MKILVISLCLFLPISAFGSEETKSSFSHIEEYIKNGNYIEAKQNLEKISVEDIGNTGALYHYLSAKILIGLRKEYDAISHLTKVYLYSEKDSKLKEESLFLKAKTLDSIGFSYEASVYYKQFISLYKNSKYYGDAIFNLARLLNKDGNYNQALYYLNQIKEDPIVLFEQAKVLQKMGKVKEATESYRLAVLANPEYLLKSEENLYYYSLNALNRNLFNLAKNNLSIINTLPLKYQAAVILGEIFLKENNHDKAMGYFKLALESIDKDIKSRALLNRSKLYLKLNDTENAEKDLKSIITTFSYTKEYYESILLYSGILLQRGRVEEAIKYLKMLIFKKNPLPEAYSFIESAINIYINKRQTNELYELWKKINMIMLDRLPTEPLFYISKILKDKNDLEYINILKFLAKNRAGNYSTEAKTILTDFYLNSGRIQTAQDYLTSIPSKEINDEIKRLHIKLSYINRNYENAYKVLKSLTKISKNDIVYVPKLIRQEKKAKLKIKFLERLLKDIGEDEKVFELLGECYEEIGEKKNMVYYYQKALDKKPDNDWLKYKLSMSLDDAEKSELLRNMAKSNTKVYSDLAKMYLKEIEINKKLKRGE